MHRTVEVGKDLWRWSAPNPCQSRIRQSRIQMPLPQKQVQTLI